MQIGTILKNDYTSDDNPIRYSIYVGCSGNYANIVYPYRGKVRKGQYRKQDIGKEENIHPVGYTDVLNRMAHMMEDELEDFAEEMERED